MTLDLPTLNAILNFVSAVFLFFGFKAVKKGEIKNHKILMACALLSSTLFLISYLIYHASEGSVPYPHYDWTRPVYFTILIPHIILAALMVPFILWGVFEAIRQKYETHKKIMRWVFPVWMFVNLSGVVIFGMLYL